MTKHTCIELSAIIYLSYSEISMILIEFCPGNVTIIVSVIWTGVVVRSLMVQLLSH